MDKDFVFRHCKYKEIDCVLGSKILQKSRELAPAIKEEKPKDE